MHLLRADIRASSNPRRMRHTHAGPELLAMDRGAGAQLTGQGESPAKTGDIFLFPPGIPHMSYAGAGQEFSCLVLQSDPGDFADGIPGDGGAGLLDRLEEAAAADNRLHVRPATATQVRSLLARALAEWQAQGAGGRCQARALAMEALVALVRDPALSAPAERGIDPGERHVAAAQRWMEQYWMQPIRLADLVALGALGRSRFLERFRAQVGSPVGDVLLAIRIREAKRLLQSGGHSMLDVALGCGFGSQSHFNHRFRHITGLSPRDWLRAGCP